MKRLFATLLLVLVVSLAFAQKHVACNVDRKFYCEVKCYEKGLKSKYKVLFDFGETVSKEVWNRSNRKVAFVDENGRFFKFKSIVDAANFFSERGWTLVETYSSTYVGKKSIKHWVFCKEAEDYDDMKEGFVTKKEYRKMKRAVRVENRLQRKAEKALEAAESEE